MHETHDQHASTPSDSDARLTPAASCRRVAIRCFALLIIGVMIADALPYAWTGGLEAKRVLSAVLNRIGLWQGEWSMFAPNPVINNGWVTVEMRTSTGQTIQRESPLWSELSGLQKFVRFRHLNFYNRVIQPWNIRGADDYIDDVARDSGEPIVEAKLFRNQLKLRMPDDGTLPTRADAEWQFSTELWSQRTYQP